MLTEIYKRLIKNKCKRGLKNNIILKSNFVSTSEFLTLPTKKIRADNNENNAKMPIMLKPISEVSNITLQIIVQFYIFNLMNASSSFDIFYQGRKGLIICS